jgi:hypothetical protein
MMEWVTQILAVLVIAAVPLGAFVCFSEGMVLSWWYEAVDKSTLPTWMKKPLATCSQCMVSAWGLPAALLLGLLPEITLALRTLLHVIMHVGDGFTHWELSPYHWIPLVLPLVKVPVYLFLAVWLQSRISD